MERRIFLWVSLLLMMVVLFSPPTVLGQADPSKTVKIRITGHMPVGQVCSTACEMFIKEAEKRSNGSLKFTYYPAGQLAMDVKAFEMCQRGGIEMAQFFTSRAVGSIPEGDLAYPYFDDPGWYARRMYDEASGGGTFYRIIKPKFAKHGLHLMPGALYSPEHSTITNKPVAKMSDYKGMKIRTSGRAAGVAVDSWGAKSVVMTSADVYMALQRGTIDGANSGLTSFRSRKWYEVLNHVQLLEEMVTSLDMIANLKWWNSLSPDHQKIIEESLRGAMIWSWEEAIKEADEDVKFLKEKGLKVVDLKKTAPGEWEKMRVATLEALGKFVGPTVGEATWREHIKMYEGTRNGSRTWMDVLKTIKW